MNIKVNEDNCKSVRMVNARYQNVCHFSSNEFWKNIGCLVLASNIGFAG